MTPWGRLLAVVAAAAAVIFLPAVAQAHPLGNFTVNVYDGIVISPRGVRVLHVVDMAEIPTFQELRRINREGEPSDAELAAWAARAARDIAPQLSLMVGGRPVALQTEEWNAQLLPGQGGLPILRLEATYIGVLPTAGKLEFRDGTFPGRIGWREVTAVGTDGAALEASSVPAESVSDVLRAYPEDLLSSPLQETRATVSFAPGEVTSGSITANSGSSAAEPRPGVSGSAFAALASRAGLSPTVVAVSLLLALGFGALHAMGPGHGKTVIAAYLLLGGGKFRHVVAVSGAVAAMHTASVLALGFVVLSAGRAFPAERLFPWLGLLSGAAALALGAGLLWSRVAGRARGHDDHHHRYQASDGPLSMRGLAALALSGGALPSPTAIVVLLASIALGRGGFGLALVGAFSLGLAVALALIGTLAVRVGSFLVPRLGRLARLVPLGSASAITVVGAILLARAAVQL